MDPLPGLRSEMLLRPRMILDGLSGGSFSCVSKKPDKVTRDWNLQN